MNTQQSEDPKELRNCVSLDGYNARGEQILQIIVPNNRWWEESHFIVDSEEERKRLGVQKIEARQYDMHGNLSGHWWLLYSDMAKLIEQQSMIHDGSVIRTRFNKGVLE